MQRTMWMLTAVCLVGLAWARCGEYDSNPGGPGDDDTSPAGDDDASPADDDDATAGDDDTELPPLPCDERFTVVPDPAEDGGLVAVSVTDTTPYVYVDLVVSGDGSPVITWGDVTGEGPWTWSWSVSGHAVGQLDMVFTADEGATQIASCSVWVVTGSGSTDDDDDTGPCEPDCAGTICGGDDGCGTPCSGGHRDDHGAVSDCRSGADCGCGVPDNTNMECTGDGLCRVRCSCDCLPPIDRSPADVAGLDHAGSCELIFRDSGDPTVWDYDNDVSLCPLDHDPVGADRCTECPPCHRDHPPSCDWDAYCTCNDERWYDGYSTECCAAGAEYCY
jgi:hypothetical protein